MNYYSIYKVTNRTNEKIYIGFSKTGKKDNADINLFIKLSRTNFTMLLESMGGIHFLGKKYMYLKIKTIVF